jgi:hypothetical protein
VQGAHTPGSSHPHFHGGQSGRSRGRIDYSLANELTRTSVRNNQPPRTSGRRGTLNHPPPLCLAWFPALAMYRTHQGAFCAALPFASDVDILWGSPWADKTHEIDFVSIATKCWANASMCSLSSRWGGISLPDALVWRLQSAATLRSGCRPWMALLRAGRLARGHALSGQAHFAAFHF